VEKRLEHVVSGLDRAQKNALPIIQATNPISNAQSGGLDVGAILGGLAQGGGSSKSESGKANAGDIANQIAGGGSPGLDQIISGLNKENQSAAKNQSIAQGQGQAKETGDINGKAQAGAQNGGAGVLIQIEKTTIVEANNQQITTEIIKEVRPGAKAAPPPTPPAEVKATVRTAFGLSNSFSNISADTCSLINRITGLRREC
jgi:hypothetical protein